MISGIQGFHVNNYFTF